MLDDFLKPMHVTARKLTANIDVAPIFISETINGKHPITADTALRLGLFFSMESRFWQNLQTEFDLLLRRVNLAVNCATRSGVASGGGLSYSLDNFWYLK